MVGLLALGGHPDEGAVVRIIASELFADTERDKHGIRESQFQPLDRRPGGHQIHFMSYI